MMMQIRLRMWKTAHWPAVLLCLFSLGLFIVGCGGGGGVEVIASQI